MSKARIAITGIRKAAESVGNYLGRKSMRGLARANRTADKAYDAIGRSASRAGDATANLVRKAVRAGDAFDNATLGPIGKATRDASAAVINKTRYARPRARETVGQINRRKGIVNPVYTPKTQVDQHVQDHKMHVAKQIFKQHGFGKVLNKPKSLKGGDYMSNVKPRSGNTIKNMREYGANADDEVYRGMKQPAFDRSKLSYDEIKPTGRSGPRYTSKQVRAGRRVVLGAAGGYAASQYFKDKKSNR